MTNLILISLLSNFWLNVSSHDLQMAIFNFSSEKEVLVFETKLIREDLELALIIESPTLDLSNNQAVGQATQKYVTNHVRLRIDGRLTKYLIKEVIRDEHYFFISAKLPETNQDWSKIELRNTCLVDEIRGHSNIIHFEFDEKLRSFRMTKKRFQITLDRS